eukprot:Tbor_TRINITY_DN4922_c0_g1::TRINITY_DN4922_c0_g1_i1::g.9667::m.9667
MNDNFSNDNSNYFMILMFGFFVFILVGCIALVCYRRHIALAAANQGTEAHPAHIEQTHTMEYSGQPITPIPPQGYQQHMNWAPQQQYYGQQPQSGYTAQQVYTNQPPFGDPNATYGQPAPTYGQPVPAYGQPAPTYGQPAPTYGQ